jgi:hypothetical protein
MKLLLLVPQEYIRIIANVIAKIFFILLGRAAVAAFIVGAGRTGAPERTAVGVHPWVAVAVAAGGRGCYHHPSLSQLPGERRHCRHP